MVMQAVRLVAISPWPYPVRHLRPWPVDALEFSDRLRSVLSGAREEATRLQHEHVGTEHLLLALLADSSGKETSLPSLAGVVLDLLEIEREKMREVLEQTVLRGRSATADDQLSYTSRAKAVLELAMAEARMSRASTVDTQHLLLGLLREERGIAAQVLLDFGVTLEKTRAELARVG
jgi:ATP-dependent Clp protease ATP-binding subunit ClpC